MRNKPLKLADLLSQRAALDRDSRIFTFLSQQLDPLAWWTYGHLHSVAGSLSAVIRRECKPGDRVLLLFDHGPYFIASFFGCLYAGVVGVPLKPPRGRRDIPRVHKLAFDAGARLVLTTTDLISKLKPTEQDGGSGDRITWLATDDPWAGQQSHFTEPFDASPNSLAYLQYTSGSTSHPRGVMMSHLNVISNLQAIDDDFRHSEDSVGVTWLPHYHDMGLVYGLLQPLFNNFPCYVLAPSSFAQRPLCWLEALTRYRGTHSGGPNFAYDLCVRRVLATQMTHLDLSSWRVAFNGSEIVRQQTMDRFTEAFGGRGFSGTAFYPAYGLAEATLKVAGRNPVASTSISGLGQLIHLNTSVSYGSFSSATQVLVVDPETGREATDGNSGEIWVRGPGVALGYWNRPHETENVFKAKLQTTEGKSDDIFLRTGDLGIIHRAELTICGRLKDVLIIRGACHHSEDIEWTVQQANFYTQSRFCAAFTADVQGEEKLVVMLEAGLHLPIAAEEVVPAIRSNVSLEHGLQVHAVAFATHLPKTSSGKVIRHACKALFLDNDNSIRYIDVAASQSPDHEQTNERRLAGADDGIQALTRVEEFVTKSAALALGSRLFRRDLGTPLASLGLDSLGALELCHAIQQNFGVDFPIWLVLESTPATLSANIETSMCKGERLPTKVVVGTNREANDVGLPVSSEQQRLWLMHEKYRNCTVYNLTAAVRIRGNLEPSLLNLAMLRLEECYPYLRSTFRFENGALTAHASRSATATLNILDLRENRTQLEEAAKRYIRADVDEPFDLSYGPLIRGLLLKIANDQSIAVFTIHHIISDLWSLRIYVRELFELYAKLAGMGTGIESSRAITDYRQFARDSNEASKSLEIQEHLNFWGRELEGVPSLIPLRVDMPRLSARTYASGEEVLVLDADKYSQVCSAARRENTTPFVILLAAFGVLLHELSGAEDIVIAIPYLNRDRFEYREVIGLFAHPMPLRADLTGNPEFVEIVRRLRSAVARAIEHHAAPFASIVERLSPKRETGRLPLAQVFFGLNPGILENQRFGELELEPYHVEDSSTDFDLFFGIMDDDGKLTARLRYASEMFKASTAREMLRSYENIVTRALASSQTRLLEFRTQPVNTAASPPHAGLLSVSATFNAKPLEEFFSFWMREFGWSLQLEFAPAGQVFQSLLNGIGRLSQDPATTKLILLRVEDWTQGSVPLEQTAREFIETLRNAANLTSTDHFVCICPKSPRVDGDTVLSSLIMETEKILADNLASIAHTTVFWGAEIAARYAVKDLDDETSDRLGGVPYTDEFYAALATTVFRNVIALRRTPLKVIACDCDNTLWKGIVAEDGVDGLHVTPAIQRLHEILLSQKRAGRLLCLCSKNEEADITKAFETLVGLGVSWNDFIAKEINWLPKSENLLSLSGQLGIDLSSFLFIDDDPLECAEVSSNYPEVLTLNVPRSEDAILFLDHYWPIDTVSTTSEGARRTELYIAERERKEHIRAFRNMTEYIQSLQLQFEISPLRTDRLQRIVELMYRTTQFNTTGFKKSAHELRLLIESNCLNGRTFRLADKFGDYGLVGAVLYSQRETDSLVVESMLLSCRALGRGVEFRMAAECGQIASILGLSKVSFRFAHSGRNRPALDFLERIIGNVELTSDGVSYTTLAETVAALKANHEITVAQVEYEKETHVGKPFELSTLRKGSADRFERIAASLRSARSVIEAVRGSSEIPTLPSPHDLPEKPLEKEVSKIWSELLDIAVLDIHSDFFELGGDSIKALRIISRIEAAFGVTLPLTKLFEERTTIASLCCSIEEALSNGQDDGIGERSNQDRNSGIYLDVKS